MNKASEGDEIPAQLFQILKDDALKVLQSIARKFGKLSSGYRTGKGQFSFQSQRKAMPKNSNYRTVALTSHTGKVMLKILQARLQQYEKCELKLHLEKAQELEIKLATFVGSSKKAREFQKKIYFCFIDYAKAFDCVGPNKL